MKKNCRICNKEIIKVSKISKKQWNSKKYYSWSCRAKGVGLDQTGKNNPHYDKHNSSWNKGKSWSNESRKKMSIAHIGMISPLRGRKKKNTVWNKNKIEWKKCMECGELTRKWKKYCSLDCAKKREPWNKQKSIDKNCIICQKLFQTTGKNKNKICCSDTCSKIQSGKTKSGKNHPMFGKTHTKEAREKISQAHKGKRGWNYKGITPINKLERRKFRTEMQHLVFERDNYTCQLCGTTQDLQVDHIQPWAEYVELRFKMENCRTVCAKCHYFITFGKPMPKEVKGWGHNLLKKGGN